MFKYKTDAEVQAMTEQEANDYAVVTKERTKRICKQSY
jgi:signal recognition particle GTPase